MIFKLKSTDKKQSGFTLIEVIVAVAISAILITAIMTTIVQIIEGHDKSSDHMETIQDTENAGFWLNRDILMAQTVTCGETAGFPLTLDWIDWDGYSNRIIYSLSGNKLQRSVLVDDITTSQTMVSDQIDMDADKTNCTIADNILTLKITSAMGDASETRIYEIGLRINQPE